MNTYLKVSVLSSVLFLAACGGGGGGTTAAIVQPVVAPPVVVDNSLITSTTPVTYSTSTQSEEIAAFNLLNAERSRCGFGMLNQNIALDTAAKNHADWQLLNHYQSHFQISGTPGFTGVMPSDRIVAAGYSTSSELVSSTDEISGRTGSNVKAGFGTSSIRGLLNAPYHLAGLVSGFREIGIAVRNDVDAASTGGARVITQINMATKAPAATQLMSASDVLTYPCAGSTSIDRQLVNESPNPVPGRDLAAAPLGSSIYIAVRDGQKITITSASMVNALTGVSVALRTPVTSSNDPNPGYYQSHQAYVSADAPLTSNTTYQVTINGANNGTAFNRNFTFTTGV